MVLTRTELDIERSLTDFDLDREVWLAKQKRFVFDKRSGLIVPAPVVRGGSFLTGTGTEVIYSNPTAGTAKNTFTTEFQINDTAGMGPVATLPAWFFLPSRGRGQAIRVVARGIISTTASPTWRWTFRLNPTVTPAVPPTGPIVGDNIAACAMTASGVANTLWEAELDVQLTIEGAAGNNSTLRGLGLVTWPGAQFTPAQAINAVLFGGSASPGTVATFDMSLLNSLTVGSTCGTSSVSNSIQLLQLLIFGLN